MDDAFRELLEQQGDNLNRQVFNAIQQLEQAAAAIRAENERYGTKRSVHDELAEQTENLKYAIDQARQETIQAINLQIEDARGEYEKQRDRKPELDVARLRRASNTVNAMSDDQVKNATFQYSSGELSLNPYEINEIRARLRTIDDGGGLEGFNDAVAIRRDDAPWVSQNAELAQLADYQDVLKQLKDDEIVLIDENAPANQPEQFSRIRAKASELVDYDNRLGQPVE